MRPMTRIFAIACLFLVFFSINAHLLNAAKPAGEAVKKDAFIKEYKDPGAAQVNDESLTSKTFSFVWNLIKYVLILLLAIALAYYGVQIATKLAVMRGVTPVGAGVIKLLETTYIGQNKALHLVEIAGEVLLVSSSQSNMQLISKIEDSEKIAQLLNAKAEAAQSIQAPFGNMLDKIIDKYKTQSGKKSGNLQVNIESTLKTLKSNLAAIRTKSGVEENDLNDRFDNRKGS